MPERLASRRIRRGTVSFRPDAEVWLERSGYFRDGAAAEGREVRSATATRENSVWEHGPRGGPVFDKRGRRVTLSDVWKVLRRSGRLASPLLHEWAMLWEARDLGLHVPEPVAAGVTRGLLFPSEDFLVTETLPGRSLFEVAGDLDSMRPEERHRIAEAAGRAVAGMHRAGVVFPDLFAKHVHVAQGPDGAWRVGFLDLTSAYRTRRPSTAERARDLGALAASFPFRLAADVRAGFLRSYLGADCWDFQEAWRAVDAASRRFLRLRRFRRGLMPRRTNGSRALRAEGSDAPVSVRDEHAGALKRLLLATLRAGLLPSAAILPHLRSGARGRLLWGPAAPLAAPRRARRIHARWRLRSLRREIARSELSPAVRRSLLTWLAGAPLAAFALTDL
jgi:hypothetical protein